MSDELIEKIAKAMHRAHYAQFPPLWDSMADYRKSEWLDHARAALAAIESSGTHVVVPDMPTIDMIKAGNSVEQGFTYSAEFYLRMLAARPKVTE